MYLRVVFYTLSTFCSFAFLTACDILGTGPCKNGNGEIKTEARDVASFNGVDMRLGGNVYVTSGPRVEVKVESFKNLLPEIKTEVEGNTLIIRSESCLDYSEEDTNIYISMPDLETAAMKASGLMRIQAVPSSNPLKIHLASSGTIRYIGSANRMSIQNSGSGDVDLEGFAFNLETNLSGSGKILGYFLHTDTATTTSTGSGHQQIWVNQILDATVKGSGNIYYRGHPYLITTLTTGSGKVVNDN